jgi:hypothetical protein
VNWGFVGKVVLVPLLLLTVAVSIPYGAILVVAGAGWMKLLGAGLITVGLRAAILALDLVWGRHPQFSDRPWERPWEEDDGRSQWPYG